MLRAVAHYLSIFRSPPTVDQIELASVSSDAAQQERLLERSVGFEVTRREPKPPKQPALAAELRDCIEILTQLKKAREDAVYKVIDDTANALRPSHHKGWATFIASLMGLGVSAVGFAALFYGLSEKQRAENFQKLLDDDHALLLRLVPKRVKAEMLIGDFVARTNSSYLAQVIKTRFKHQRAYWEDFYDRGTESCAEWKEASFDPMVFISERAPEFDGTNFCELGYRDFPLDPDLNAICERDAVLICDSDFSLDNLKDQMPDQADIIDTHLYLQREVSKVELERNRIDAALEKSHMLSSRIPIISGVIGGLGTLTILSLTAYLTRKYHQNKKELQRLQAELPVELAKADDLTTCLADQQDPVFASRIINLTTRFGIPLNIKIDELIERLQAEYKKVNDRVKARCHTLFVFSQIVKGEIVENPPVKDEPLEDRLQRVDRAAMIALFNRENIGAMKDLIPRIFEEAELNSEHQIPRRSAINI